jgi:hypothetical protein
MMTPRKKRARKAGSYLPFLSEEAPASSGDAPADWYSRQADGYKELTAESDARRDLMIATLREPERARKQTLAWLAEDKAAADTKAH